MAVDWTPHRFSGGVLALDVANTVVHRDRPERRFDRFADPAEVAHFAAAAARLRPGEFGGRPLSVADPVAIRPKVIALREATDALFRHAAAAGEMRTAHLAPFLRASGKAMEDADEPFAPGSGVPAEPLAFEVALGLSALSLLEAGRRARIRICRNCAWLFADRSRNGSRAWCDMAVCGNRRKAERHRRRRNGREEIEHG